MGGQSIYRYGDLSEHGPEKFTGWPWHILPLGETHGDGYLYLHVRSTEESIGLFGNTRIGSVQDHVFAVVSRDTHAIVIALGNGVGFFLPTYVWYVVSGLPYLWTFAMALVLLARADRYSDPVTTPLGAS